LDIPSNFLYRTRNDAAKVLHAALNTLEFTGKRACAKKPKSEKTQLFVNFDVNFLEFWNELMEQNLTHSRGRQPLSNGRKKMKTVCENRPLGGVKLAPFQYPITPNRK